MKKMIFTGIAIAAMLLTANTQASAQSFLKKLAKTASNLSSSVSSSSDATKDTASVKSLNWDEIPQYEVKQVTVTNADGTVKKNDDDTPIVTYRLFDQKGNMRSPEAVELQQKKINKAIGNILLKVGGGAAVGVAAGLLASKGKAGAGVVGGLAGAAVGAALSAKDIKRAKELKKSMKEQEAMLAKYKQTFTAEGKPIKADADIMNIEGFDKCESVSMTAESLKAQLSDPNYNLDNGWEVPEAI